MAAVVVAAKEQLAAAKKQGDFYETLFRNVLEGKGTRQDKQPILKILNEARGNIERIRVLLNTGFTDQNKAELKEKVNIELARIGKLQEKLNINLPTFDVAKYKQWLQIIKRILENMERGLITDYLDAQTQKKIASVFGSTGQSKTGGGKNNLRF